MQELAACYANPAAGGAILPYGHTSATVAALHKNYIIVKQDPGFSMPHLPALSSQEIASVLKALPDPAFLLTRSGRYAAIFGGADVRYYDEIGFLAGKAMAELLVPAKAEWFVGEIHKALATRSLHVVEYGLDSDDILYKGNRPPLKASWFEGRVQALEFQVDGEDAVLWVVSNITARHQLEAQLRLHSEIDELSGLYNRRKLMGSLAEHYQVFARYGTATTLLIFDIDHFKNINDQFGHLFGDKAIRAAADVCRDELRSTDFPARFGGDEFVVLMPHTTRDQAAPIAERLRLRVAEALLRLGAVGGGATISGGLSEFLPGDAHAEDVLKRADDALYRAKRGGRNRIASV
jgi:diguanylate cyclase (GGDEF)-like protein